MPSQIEFSTCIGVDGCGCPISSNVVMITVSSLVLINRAAHSSSEADAITFLIICDMARISPLLSFWFKFFGPKKMSLVVFL